MSEITGQTLIGWGLKPGPYFAEAIPRANAMRAEGATDAVILEGVDSDLSRASLYSTVHGAGRVMSRTEARGRFAKDERGKKIRQPGRVRHYEWQAWIRERGVHLLGGEIDEAPQAYRRLPDALAQHEGTIRVLHTLRPFAVAMAGEGTVDPYKD